MWSLHIDPLIAAGVFIATATTDAVYVMFTSAVIARQKAPAASWSSLWYLLSAAVVISYTEYWAYVVFAAVGSWIGVYATMVFLHRAPPIDPAPVATADAPGRGRTGAQGGLGR